MRSSLSGSYDDFIITNINNQPLTYRTTVQPTSQQTEMKLKQFQTLKQINRILDSNPQSQQAMQQKIRSLIVMFQRQLDINQKLQAQLSMSAQQIHSLQKQLHYKTTQSKTYQTTIIQLKEHILTLQQQNKDNIKKLSQSKQQIKFSNELVQKMRQTYTNQKYSMENQLNYLKQKNIDHFKEKLNIINTQNILQEDTQRPITHSKPKSGSKTTRNQRSSKKHKKEDIIRRNILALSKKQNELKSGENLLKKFQQNKILASRMNQIQKGHYQSLNILRH